MTREQIAALPAAWYAAQPIPPRLLRALYEPVGWTQAVSKTPAAVLRSLWPRPKLTPVEQAHLRASNRLLRRAK